MYAEVKIRNEWRTVGNIFDYEYHDPEGPTIIFAYSDGEENEHNKIYTMEPYGDRNYELFAILADVRNRYGIKPIDEPRGLPEDVSRYIKKRSDKWGVDAHSHSWMNLADLDSYNWDATYTDSGFVDVRGYKSFKEKGSPNQWCQGASGARVEHITNKEMDNIVNATIPLGDPRVLSGDIPFGDKHYYTHVTWQWTRAYTAGSFYTDTIPALRALLDKKGVEDVRIVFWFDN